MDNRADPPGAAPRPSRSTIMRSFRLFACALTLMVIGSIAHLPAQAQQPAPARQKVVLQVSDADSAKWNLALNNAKNIQTDLGATNVDVEIVAYGPGIAMLKADSVVGNRIDEALTAGVKVVACENTMRAQKLAQADMLGKIGYVPAGVVEIMQRQQQGWAYIRP
jgi:intracellular sulfur oxidation DsrE/DsrF family protein